MLQPSWAFRRRAIAFRALEGDARFKVAVILEGYLPTALVHPTHAPVLVVSARRSLATSFDRKRRPLPRKLSIGPTGMLQPPYALFRRKSPFRYAQGHLPPICLMI
jgi:hypothetical protein